MHVLTVTDVQDDPAGSFHQRQGDISALCRVIMSGCSLFCQKWDGASFLKGNFFFTWTGLFGQRQRCFFGNASQRCCKQQRMICEICSQNTNTQYTITTCHSFSPAHHHSFSGSGWMHMYTNSWFIEISTSPFFPKRCEQLKNLEGICQ